MDSQIFTTENANQTQKLGADFAANLKNGGVVCLYGDLGSGKTTFTQGLARGLGIKRRIISPTFISLRQYLPNFYHLDLYRIESLNDAKSLGIEEIFSDQRNIVVIEWPEKIQEILPAKRREIFFKYLDEKKREIVIARSETTKQSPR